MLFNSSLFIFAFLPVTLILFIVIGRRGYHQSALLWLVGVSLVFYGWMNPLAIFIILASILFNYGIGRLILRVDKKKSKKLLLAFGITGNIVLLGYFKYANFLIDNLNRLFIHNYQIGEILLPLGISFFTFQQIAYIVDVYRGETTEGTFLNYCLFVTFFPKLIAGPIVYHKELVPQFKQPALFQLDVSRIAQGLTIFLLGLFKKVAIADSIRIFADPVFHAATQGTQITFFVAWQGALAYTLQIYFDFSAYSDMAIGIGHMMGINLPINFNSPYKAKNIIDFWRRWHITLSRFLRDYVYIPLGGNRKGEGRRSLNVIATMLICGFWHGAGWTFIIWGALHGFYLMINHGWKKLISLRGSLQPDTSFLGRFAGMLITFLSVTFAWVLFRAEDFSSALAIWKGMVGYNGAVLPSQVVALVPWLKGVVQSAGSVALLGNGSIMGIIECLLMTLMGLGITLFSKNLYEISQMRRVVLLVLTFGFSFQAVVFGTKPAEFIYFRF